jgi:hypothetical protein
MREREGEREKMREGGSREREPLLWTDQMSYICDCLGREVE